MTISLKELLSPGGENLIDQREFKNWQDFYHGKFNGDTTNTIDYDLPQSTRVVNGVSSNRAITSQTTWTVPAGVTKVRLTCVGGGGGGGRYNSSYYGGDAGGGGGFSSAEYTVTPGETLTINVGAGGGGRYLATTGHGATGGSTSITDSSTGGNNISLSATGGAGGSYANAGSNGGGSASTAGINKVSSTAIESSGGRGGYGSANSFGFGPEGYGAGGGGSAGSMMGPGHMGGQAFQGGYSYGSAGGAGIGGHGGYSDGSRGQFVGEHKSGSGGGSAGPGIGGGWGYTPSAYSYFDTYSEGGAGHAGSAFMGDYCDSHMRVNGLGGLPDYHEDRKEYWFNSKGARYGDGEATSPGGGYYTQQANRLMATYSSGFNNEFIILKPKTFNGVLGRLWGGGGSGQLSNNYTFGSYNRSGGDGGSGGGGGGAMGITTTWNSAEKDCRVYSDWDPVNMAWRTRDGAMSVNGWRINGNGGHGGALGGGGGSACHAYGGNGGIGGGGGGAGGHYTGSYFGYGGNGGPGYVLIEW